MRSPRLRPPPARPTSETHVPTLVATPVVGPLDLRPMQIPGYDDLVLIAHGGFATVYRARQVAFEREVAVKVLTVELDEARDRARFHREVAAMGRLTGHPHIVTILDSGFTPDGRPYLTTPYYPQGSLGQQLAAAGPFAVREVLAVGVAMAGALDAAHRRGILHRDIKPENILLSRYGEVALTDFGIATDVGPVDGRDGPTTHTTQAFTLGHAAPEVLELGRATDASDVYSLASSLWMLLTGRSPFGGASDEGIIPRMLRVKTEPVPPIGRDDVPPSLERCLVLALAKAPEDRLVPAAAFGRALQDIQRELDLPVTELRTESVVDLRAEDRTPPGGLPRPVTGGGGGATGAAASAGAVAASTAADRVRLLDRTDAADGSTTEDPAMDPGVVVAREVGPDGTSGNGAPVALDAGSSAAAIAAGAAAGAVAAGRASSGGGAVADGAVARDPRSDGTVSDRAASRGTTAAAAGTTAGPAAGSTAATPDGGSAAATHAAGSTASPEAGSTPAGVTPVVLGGSGPADLATSADVAAFGAATGASIASSSQGAANATGVGPGAVGKAKVPRWQGSHTQAAATAPDRLAEPVWRDDFSGMPDATTSAATTSAAASAAASARTTAAMPAAVERTTMMPAADRGDPARGPGGPAAGAMVGSGATTEWAVGGTSYDSDPYEGWGGPGQASGRPPRRGEVPPRARRGRPLPPPPRRRRKVLPVLLVLLVILGAFGIGYLTMRNRSSLTTTDAGPTTTVTTVPPTSAVTTPTTAATTVATTVAPTTISTPTGPPSTKAPAATTAPPTTAPPTTAKPAPRPVGALIAPADLPAELAQAAGVSQQAATALAVGDWNKARALVPSLRDSDNKELAAAWRGLVQATIVVIDAKPAPGGAVLRLGEVAHELSGDTKRTSLYCVTWTVKDGKVVGMADQQILQPTPWRDGEYADPGEAAPVLSAQCRKL